MLSSLTTFAADCSAKTFFGIPPWYEYIKGSVAQKTLNGQTFCDVHVSLFTGGHLDLSVVSLVLLALLDMALRLGALVAVGFIIFAGIQYATAQGEPDKAKRALGTIINALVGLGITIVAAAVVSFLGGRLGQ
jgi:hypothetical protein